MPRILKFVNLASSDLIVLFIYRQFSCIYLKEHQDNSKAYSTIQEIATYIYIYRENFF